MDEDAPPDGSGSEMEFEYRTMVDQQLLDILVCPETKQALHMADAEVLERLNAAIREGSVADRGGRKLDAPVTEGLIREAGDVLYPIRDDIPIMLVDQAIPLPQKP
ncbi:MAG: Trm112 family protein [Gemmatimonadota bacterium]|nr:Trm112 family protein [Gemmatimonadota bacterium]